MAKPSHPRLIYFRAEFMASSQHKNERDLLARFPKRRSELPERYKSIYIDHYQMNRSGASPATSLAQRMESWMHRKVAEDCSSRSAGYSTLEIGAGNLNHLPYESASRIYDIVEPFKELYENSPFATRVSTAYSDLGEITDAQYDRIISIAAFEHLCDLPLIVAQCGLLLAPEGTLRVSIPSEGTLLWWLGWRLTTGVEFQLRHRLNYGTMMRHEHVNTAAEIAAVLKVFFGSVRRTVFGVAPELSFYQFLECRSPNIKKCLDHLDRERTR
jgi:hypothetical protein